MDGPPIHGNTRLEVIWTAIPAILIVGLCVYAYVVLDDIEKAPANDEPERIVNVTGQQFAWTFDYPSEGRTASRSTSTAALPARGTSPVKFDVHAKDVLHDFWVPEFRMKIDAVPGHHDQLPRDAQPTSAATRSSARSSAASATPSCARPSTSSPARTSTPGSAEQGRPPGGGRRRTAARPPRPTARRSSPRATARRRLRRLPHAGRRRHERRRPARTSTRRWPGRTRRRSRRRSSTRRGDRRGLPAEHHAQRLRVSTLSPEELDALVNYLDEVTRSDPPPAAPDAPAQPVPGAGVHRCSASRFSLGC